MLAAAFFLFFGDRAPEQAGALCPLAAFGYRQVSGPCGSLPHLAWRLCPQQREALQPTGSSQTSIVSGLHACPEHVRVHALLQCHIWKSTHELTSRCGACGNVKIWTPEGAVLTG